MFRHLQSPVHQVLLCTLKTNPLNFDKTVASLTDFYTSNIHNDKFGRHVSLLGLKNELVEEWGGVLNVCDAFVGLVNGIYSFTPSQTRLF
jgi:hypothetical protein